MTATPAISAPPPVVHAWKEAAARAMHMVNRATDPSVTDGLDRDAPCAVRELVDSLVDALTHAAGILLGSVANATPGARGLFDGELRVLVDRAAAAQACAGAFRGGGVCPIPDPGGAEYRCRCEPDARAGCEKVADDVGVGVQMVGDDGCEGGVR